MIDKLAQLNLEKESYDQASKDIINTLFKTKKEIDSIDEMKKTDGWKLLDERIRGEVHNRILEMVKDDYIIQSLLGLLHVASTKDRAVQLDEELKKLLPE